MGWAEGPDVAAFGVAPLGQHLDGALVGVQHAAGQHRFFEGRHQGQQRLAHRAGPLAEGGAGNLHPHAGKHLALAVHRQVVVVLGDGDLGQQRLGGLAFVDELRRHGRLGHALAGPAGPAPAHMALHLQAAGQVVQLLADVLADAHHGAAAAAGAGLAIEAGGLVPHIHPGQRFGQRAAHRTGAHPGLGRAGRLLEVFELLLQRGDVFFTGLIKQGALVGVQHLALGCIAPVAQQTQLVAQGLDLGLAVAQRELIALGLVGAAFERVQQLAGQAAHAGLVHGRQRRRIRQIRCAGVLVEVLRGHGKDCPKASCHAPLAHS